tara:strand:+ start:556 stop:750 length:195 start_codon:yes stop_codon:yes gene_type:complete
MQAFLLGLAKSLMTEWLMKRLAYMALRALVASTKNSLDDEAVYLVGQSLGLEDDDTTYQEDQED